TRQFAAQGAGTVFFSADGAGIGNGGSITLAANTSASPMTIGNGNLNFNFSATGGSLLSLAGNGGSLTVVARDITVDPAGIVVGPLGDVGNGATISLTAALGLS